MRKVKLQDTQEFCYNTEAFKADNGKYYSSQEAFLKIQKENQYRQECINLAYNDFLSLPISKYFLKRLSEHKAYSYEVIFNCLNSEKNTIKSAMNKINFDSEYHKINYLIACIDNKIDKYKIPIFKKTNINNDIDLSNFKEPIIKKQTKDVSKFLGDI